MIVSGLDTEWSKALKSLRPTESEYLEVLKLESLLLDLSIKSFSYFERVGATESSCTMKLIEIRHLYFKHQSLGDVVLADQERRARFGSHGAHPASCSSTAVAASKFVHPAYVSKVQARDPSVFVSAVPDLCQFIYSRGDNDRKVHATLMEVYHQHT